MPQEYFVPKDERKICEAEVEEAQKRLCFRTHFSHNQIQSARGNGKGHEFVS